MQNLLRMQELDGLEDLVDDVARLVLAESAFAVEINVQVFFRGAKKKTRSPVS